MGNLRVIATLIVVTIIALLSIFQMQIRGYEKIARLNEWVLYVNPQAACEEGIQIEISENNSEFLFTCMNQDEQIIKSDTYIVKSGFEEHTLEDSLKAGYITFDDLAHVIDIVIILPDSTNIE
ncbi:MAG: hypothetical protein JXR62_02305 [Bacilli bacterium]|nr:hypothetical protein [Bacilli bacterium]